MTKKLYTIKEASEQLGITKWQLTYAIKQGRVKTETYRIGLSTKDRQGIPQDELTRLLGILNAIEKK